MSEPRAVAAERVIAAPAAAIFAFLADPSNHPRLDGSGMVRGHVDGDVIARIGDSFSMQMRLVIPYRATSTVVEFEDGRRIAWVPYLFVFGRRLLGGQRWRYELEPTTDGATRVRETYVWGDARTPGLLQLGGYPKKMQSAMEQSLKNLDDLVTSTTADGG
jgi:uncharacterized protein YndB with AHSA1/START domain